MKGIIKRIWCSALAVLGCFWMMVVPAVGQGYELSSEGAWCWFADPRAIHHENDQQNIRKTYVGYIDVHGNIKAMQYDFVTGKQVEVLVRSWFQPDDHNNPTFLVLPDDRVMIFYSRHTDERCFYYRVSKKPGDITTLGEEKRLETDHNTTYPSPFILTDDPEHIYLCWRGLNWHPTIARLSLPDAADNVAFVDVPHQIVQSTGSRPYAKYVSNGKDKIYIAYTTGHPDNENPNFLYFSYVNINSLTLHDVEGTELAKIEEGAFRVNKTGAYVQEFPATVVDNPQERDWVWQVAMDKDGSPVIAFVRISADKKSHDYYYGRWTGTEWRKTFLANGGGHFHQTQNLEMCYSGGMAIDPDNVHEIYCSVPIVGEHGQVYELLKFTMDDDGKIGSTEAVTADSRKNNVRPYVIGGSTGTPLRLTWMQGDYYDWIVSKTRPGYPTAIYTDFKGLESPSNIDHDFRISVKIDMDTAQYHGSLFQRGDLSYRLDGKTLKPEIVYKGKSYRSTNVLGTADSWRYVDRGTNGKWYPPAKLESFELTLNYEEGVLSTYINNLLDQRVEIENVPDSYGQSLDKPKFDGYLFAYFEGSGKGEQQEQLRFGVSADAVNWTALNGNSPILASADISQTGGIRDPHIYRGENDGRFYLVATDMFTQKNGWETNPGIILMKSDDLLDWKHSILDLAKLYPKKFGNVKWVWAPHRIQFKPYSIE